MTVTSHPPDTSSRWRFVSWAMRGRYPALALAVLLGVVGSVAEALVPLGIGRALDAALSETRGDLVAAVGVLAGLLAAVIGTTVTRFAVSGRTRIDVTYRLDELIGRHAAEVKDALPREVPAGEVATTVAGDTGAIGSLPDAVAQFVGAVIAYAVVAFYLLGRSVPLGLLVLLGVPLLVLGMTRVVRPLEARQRTHRRLLGALTVLGVDMARGLKVLRGIGGEGVLRTRYRALSQEVRGAGMRVAGTQAVLDAAQVLLPGVFLVVVTWFGARLAVSGQFGAGDLVALYGASAFLVQPISVMAGLAGRLSAAGVGADRVLAILRVRPRPVFAGTARAAGGPLHDPMSGMRAQEGVLTVVVTVDPDVGRDIAGRLAGLPADGEAPGEIGGTPLAELGEADVRRLILLNDSSPHLFSGDLRAVLDPRAVRGDDDLWAAVRAACAEDVVEALPDGLSTVMDEGARSLSGGQRQRIALARAFAADVDHLVLVDPTSAVDATTETEMARRLREFRQGRTTVVFSTSPPLVEVADRVVFVGEEVHDDTHERLRERVPGYRGLVTQGEG